MLAIILKILDLVIKPLILILPKFNDCKRVVICLTTITLVLVLGMAYCYDQIEKSKLDIVAMNKALDSLNKQKLTEKEFIDRYTRETLAIRDLLMKCENGAIRKNPNINSDPNCVVSRWLVAKIVTTRGEENLANLYRASRCDYRYSKAKKTVYPLCIDFHGLYKNSPSLDISRFTSSKTKETCAALDMHTLKVNNMYEYIDYMNKEDMNMEPDLFTYCIGPNKMTLLIQRKNHSALKANRLSRYGCESRTCKEEVRAMHLKVK